MHTTIWKILMIFPFLNRSAWHLFVSISSGLTTDLINKKNKEQTAVHVAAECKMNKKMPGLSTGCKTIIIWVYYRIEIEPV